MYEGQKKQIHPKIFLYKTQNSTVHNTMIYTFKVEVLTLKILEIECDFTGSSNITIKEPATSTFICSCMVRPFQPPSIVARLELLPQWRLKTKFRLTLKPPSKQDQAKWVKRETTSLQTEVNKVQVLFNFNDVSLMKFQDVQAQLQQSQIKFVDIDFQPVQISILGKQDITLSDDTLTHWRRPCQYINQPFAISYKIDPNTLQSGKLGHQSFYSVLRCLAHKSSLIQRLFSNINQISQQSIYKLYLCNNGQWQAVIVDDYFPCYPVGQPKFIKSSLNQIWPNLIEKAYAKTFNSYLSLRDLSVKDVFQDLTGYPTYVMPIEFEYDQIKRVQSQINSGCLVSLYTTQQARQFQQDDFNSIANRAYLIQAISSQQVTVSTQKGLIQMTLDEAKDKFKMACVCNVSHWQQIKIPGTFVKVEHSTDSDQINFVSKWYYTFDLSQQTQMSFCLRQEDIHIGDNAVFKPYLDISLVLFKRGHNYIPVPVEITDFTKERSIYINMTLQQGSYILVPITISEFKSTIDMPQKQFISDIFRKLDLTMTRQLKFPQIKTFCNYAKQLIDQQKYQIWLKKYTKLKGFGLSAFKKLWNDKKVLWKPNLDEFSTQRLFILSFHSKKQIALLLKNSKGTELDNRSHVAIIRKFGTQIKTKYKQIKLFILKMYLNPITYFVQNVSANPVEVQLDCSKSNGYSFMPLTGKSKRRLQVSQSEYIMRLIPNLNGTLNTLAHHQEVTVRQSI